MNGRLCREQRKSKFNKQFQSMSLKTNIFFPWNIITVLCQIKKLDYLPSASENRITGNSFRFHSDYSYLSLTYQILSQTDGMKHLIMGLSWSPSGNISFHLNIENMAEKEEGNESALAYIPCISVLLNVCAFPKINLLIVPLKMKIIYYEHHRILVKKDIKYHIT